MRNGPVLVTIGFSHFCEKARWALELSEVRFEECARLPIFHMLETVPRGGRSTPLLELDGQTLTDSTDILIAVDGRLPAERRLYPADPGQRAEVERFEELFDEKLGPAARFVVYQLLLPGTERMVPWLSTQGGPLERWLMPLGWRLWVVGLRRALGLEERRLARQVERVTEVFEVVEERLRDGRPYLVGDRFSAADLTFAALSTPLVCPPPYEARLPPRALWPPELVELVERWRARPGGQFALRLYRDHRPG